MLNCINETKLKVKVLNQKADSGNLDMVVNVTDCKSRESQRDSHKFLQETSHTAHTYNDLLTLFIKKRL